MEKRTITIELSYLDYQRLRRMLVKATGNAITRAHNARENGCTTLAKALALNAQDSQAIQERIVKAWEDARPMRCPDCKSSNVLETDNLHSVWCCLSCGYTDDGAEFDTREAEQ